MSKLLTKQHTGIEPRVDFLRWRPSAARLRALQGAAKWDSVRRGPEQKFIRSFCWLLRL